MDEKLELGKSSRHDRRYGGTYYGGATITFRGRYLFDGSMGEYHVNGKGDGWFRSCEGNSDGYGLAITEVKLTGKKIYTENPNIVVYKAKMKYIPISSETGWPEEEFIYLYVNTIFTVEEVLKYIEENNSEWRP